MPSSVRLCRTASSISLTEYRLVLFEAEAPQLHDGVLALADLHDP
jgi:hypothetical protein